MIDLKTLTMQIINGDASGIKICRIAGSTLVTIVIPRELLSEAKGLPEIPKRGIYYLLDDNKGRLKRVYAGQTVQGIQRLDDHNQRKDWWNKAVMFLAPDTEFSMDVVSGLESIAIKYIKEHGAYEVENTNDPKPYISPYNEAFIHALHEDILFRMALLGFGLDAVGDDSSGVSNQVFHTFRRGVRGLGRYNVVEGSFDVLPGSKIDIGTRAGTQRHPNNKLESLRSKLIDSGELTPGDDDVHELSCTLHFDSPSAAAVFVLGGSCNGWTEWVDENGRTLSFVYRESKAD
ncbi:GIY-YIG nuclease family protein [Adlercreutzia sp. CNCM I-6207]